MHAPVSRTSRRLHGGPLADWLADRFGGAPLALDLYERVLDGKGFDDGLCQQLIRLARRSGEAWEFRQFCALLLQWQFLRIPAKDIDTLDRMLVRIGLKSRAGRGRPLKTRVLDEGFSSRKLGDFAPELRAFLGRQKQVLAGLRGRRTTVGTLRQLAQLCLSPTKLALGRYLFTPQDVVDEIRRKVRLSRGFRAPLVEDSRLIAQESAHARKRLPRYEREILELLGKTEEVYWVGDQTRSELNALAEYPIGSVVLVIKPPGSSWEFEIKRAGVRGPRPLDAVFYHEDGRKVPASHRLKGGSITWCLQFEADASARLHKFFRLVHGRDASMSVTHQIRSVYGIPTENGEVGILDYFTTSESYGAEFETMRRALRKSTDAGMHRNRPGVAELPGELGYSHNFLIKFWPGQAIQSGNSSFRVDLLERYLSSKGAHAYFAKGLERRAKPGEAMAFTEAVLQEALGHYVRPKTGYTSHARFVAAAFAVPANRRTADRQYLSLLEQIGIFWGTLLALRGFSRGESFVSRNVGIRSVWEDGQWRAKLAFMDHDDLHLPDASMRNFLPLNVLDGQCTDQNYIVGLAPQHQRISLVTRIGKIYRVDQSVKLKGHRKLHAAKKRAYRKSQRKVLECKEVRTMFKPMFADRIDHWDRAMRVHLRAIANGRDPKAAVRRLLGKWGYGENIAEHYLKALYEYDDAWTSLFRSE